MLYILLLFLFVEFKSFLVLLLLKVFTSILIFFFIANLIEFGSVSWALLMALRFS
jgi:hypothetical protein